MKGFIEVYNLFRTAKENLEIWKESRPMITKFNLMLRRRKLDRKAWPILLAEHRDAECAVESEHFEQQIRSKLLF